MKHDETKSRSMIHEEHRKEPAEERVFTGRNKKRTGKKAEIPKEQQENIKEEPISAKKKRRKETPKIESWELSNNKSYSFTELPEKTDIKAATSKSKYKKRYRKAIPVRQILQSAYDITYGFTDSEEEQINNNVAGDIIREEVNSIEHIASFGLTDRRTEESFFTKNGSRIHKADGANGELEPKKNRYRMLYHKQRKENMCRQKQQQQKFQNMLKAKKKKEAIKAVRSRSILGVLLLVLLFVILIVMFIGSTNFMLNSFSTTIASTYLSKPSEIDQTELAFTELEMELQETIDSIEDNYPDFDEYEYNLGEIGHDPGIFISFLSAQHIEFTAEQMKPIVQAVFEEMYQLSMTEHTEIRERVITQIDEETGEEIEVTEEYEVKILRVELMVTPLEEIALNKMSSDQKILFDGYQTTRGALQTFGIPVDYYWYYYVSGYYGYRKNPVTEEMEFHRGIDIAVPEGTTVYATHDGIIKTIGYDERYGNYIVIENKDGYVTKYGHLSEFQVHVGQHVRMGHIIGKTGNTGVSTGSHLHLECMYQGQYYNPYFYFNAGTETNK